MLLITWTLYEVATDLLKSNSNFLKIKVKVKQRYYHNFLKENIFWTSGLGGRLEATLVQSNRKNRIKIIDYIHVSEISKGKARWDSYQYLVMPCLLILAWINCNYQRSCLSGRHQDIHTERVNAVEIQQGARDGMHGEKAPAEKAVEAKEI